jgi:hypothetical protein
MTNLRRLTMGMAILGRVMVGGATPAAAEAPGKPYESTFFEHPVFDYDLTKVSRRELEKDRLDVMQMTEAQIRAAVPTQTGLMNVGCPNWDCEKGRTWNRKGQLPKSYAWQFNARQPDRIVCPACGERYPDNPKYPMTQSITILNPAQEKVTLPYWEDTQHDRKRTRFFLRGMLNAARWDWYQDRMATCSMGYLMTGDEEYAYTACLLLDAMCNVFPHWVMCDDYGDGYKSYPPGVHHDQDDTRMGRRGGSEHFGGPHMRMVYDVCYNSEGMRRVSETIGRDLRQKFLDNVVKLTNPQLFNDTPLRTKWTQACPGSEKITAGKLLHQPRLLRYFIHCQKRAPYRVFGADGAFFQGPGYASIHLFNMMHMRDLNGYSDPPNFPILAGEQRYENWWFPYGPYETFYNQAYTIWRDICRPDGSAIVFNDAGGGYTSATFMDRTPRKSSGNVMKHGLKHVVLGDGEGNDQIQTHMGFGEGGKHLHIDTLGLQLYAFGHYLLDDITYPKHRLRPEYSSSLFHNTVAVDKASQWPHLVDGDPTMYEPRIPGIAVVRVDAARAYAGTTDTYERTLVNVTTDIDRPYVVDVFRVKGGDIHDYMLLSAYRYPSTVQVSLNMRTLPGTRPLMREGAQWKEPTRGVEHDYGIFTNVRAADAARDFTLTYRLKQPWTRDPLYAHPDKPAVGTRHHFIGAPNAQAMLADIPRRADGDKPLIELEQMPHFILRRESGGAMTIFVAVHEPFMGEPAIVNVRRMPSREETVALEVRMHDRVDRVVLSVEDAPVYEGADGLRTDAKLAVVSRPQGRRPVAAMVGGTMLRDEKSGVDLTNDIANYTGTIVRSLRTWDHDSLDGFEVTGDSLPPVGEDLNGAWIFVRNRGEMQEIPDGLCPTDYDDWKRKHHDRARDHIESIGLDKTGDPEVADWLRGERRVQAMPHTGGGWAFEIERVSKRDGRTFIVCKNDHGLAVDRKTCQELFYPHRTMQGKPTRWWIDTAASTEPFKDLRKPKVVHTVTQPELPPDRETGLMHTQDEKTTQVLDNVDLQWFLYKLPQHHVHRFEGYLRIPRRGTYTFHYRPGTDGSLTIGDKAIIERTGRIGTPMPRVAHVELDAGLVPMEFTIDVRRINKYWTPSSDFEWEGPGLDRRPLTTNDFEHES